MFDERGHGKDKRHKDRRKVPPVKSTKADKSREASKAAQARAVVLLAAGEKAVDVAKQLGVTDDTISRWRTEDPEFARALAKAIEGTQAAGLEELRRGTVKAARKLVELVDSQNEAVAKDAARAVLDRVGLGAESTVNTPEPMDHEARIKRLRKILGVPDEPTTT